MINDLNSKLNFFIQNKEIILKEILLKKYMNSDNTNYIHEVFGAKKNEKFFNKNLFKTFNDECIELFSKSDISYFISDANGKINFFMNNSPLDFSQLEYKSYSNSFFFDKNHEFIDTNILCMFLNLPILFDNFKEPTFWNPKGFRSISVPIILSDNYLIGSITLLYPEIIFTVNIIIIIKSLIKTLKEWEKKIIEDSLENFNYNFSKTAKILDINRTTLYNKIKKYSILIPNENRNKSE